MDNQEKHYAFFQNRQCEYFPCHKGIKEEDFNCLFCYCPLYMLGKECGGNPNYKEKGIKDCSSCTFPHRKDNYCKVTAKFSDIVAHMNENDMAMNQHVKRYQKNLRCGITTGTCAAAAAQAAAMHLLLDYKSEYVNVQLPGGDGISIPVHLVECKNSYCEYMVVKDSGDDPDVTNGCQVHVGVGYLKVDAINAASYVDENASEHCLFQDDIEKRIFLDGGIGIGKITKEGLEQELGYAAINKVPRDMIFGAVRNCYEQAGCEQKLLVTVSVPNGEELAKRTFNPRLGIEGGISILGTTGILEPMSEQAIIDTIEVEIRQRTKLNQTSLLICPGNYGQAYIQQYLGLSMEDSIKCSNYIGATLDLAISYDVKEVLLVGNIGKLIKLAAGIMNTHSKTADGRAEIMATHIALCGGTSEMMGCIMECVTTEQMLDCLEEWNLREQVLASIAKKVETHISHRVGDHLKVGVMIFSEHYGWLCETTDAKEIRKHLCNDGKEE